MDADALAQLSNNLIYSAIAVYTLAMVGFAGQLAFGSQGRLARSAALVAAGPEAAAPVETARDDQPAAGAANSRGDRLGRVAVSLTVLGFGLHVASTVARGLAAGRAPFGNMYEFSSAGALAAVAVFLVLLVRRDVRYLGVFVLVPVVLSLGLAITVLYTDAEQLVPALQSYWLTIHVTAAIVSFGAFTVGAGLTVLYLLQRRAGRAGRSGRAGRLPAAETLDRAAYRVHAFAFPLWTFAIMAGAIWAEDAWGRYWGWDPKETWALVTWVVYAAYLHARATAGWRGRGAAWIALAGYACFLFNYFGVNIWITGLHSYAGV
jgi:cytochrome c-type biogenesis protein CcsB